MSIIGSQSRYELQQQIALNPTGMKPNITNRFGTVDSSNRISAIKNQSHKIRVASIGQGTVAAQPVLNENYWGNQSSMYFDGVGAYVDDNNPYFKPNWDQPSFFGCKLHYLKNPDAVQPIYYRSETNSSGYGFLVSIMGTFHSPDSIEVVMNAYNTSTSSYVQKIVYTTEKLVDNTTYDIVFLNAGTDDSMDWKVYINGVEATLNVLAPYNQSFIGAVSYPGLFTSKIEIGKEINNTNWFKGYMGKVIEGLGTPNITALRNALNTI